MAKMEIKGKNVVITLPFDAEGHDSSTGKSTVHATTSGYVVTDKGYSFSVNVIKKK